MQLSLYLRRLALDRGPQNSDQQERHGGPMKPDVVEAAKHVGQNKKIARVIITADRRGSPLYHAQAEERPA